MAVLLGEDMGKGEERGKEGLFGEGVDADDGYWDCWGGYNICALSRRVSYSDVRDCENVLCCCF